MNKYNIQKSPSEFLKELAQKIRILRKGNHLSQEELAERSGVSLGSLKRFERTGKVSLESFLKLLLILGRLNEMDKLLLTEENTEIIEKLFSDKTRK